MSAGQREVLVVAIEDRPGALGGLARRLVDPNVNIDLADTAHGSVKIVIAQDAMESARRALPQRGLRGPCEARG